MSAGHPVGVGGADSASAREALSAVGMPHCSQQPPETLCRPHVPHRPAGTWEGSARPAGCRARGVGVAPEPTLTQVSLESDPAALGLELSVKSPFVPSAQPRVHTSLRTVRVLHGSH